MFYLTKSFIQLLYGNQRVEKAKQCLLLFLAYSLRYLIVRHALIIQPEVRSPKTESLRSIIVSTYGILFFETPHYASDVTCWNSKLYYTFRAALH